MRNWCTNGISQHMNETLSSCIRINIETTQNIKSTLLQRSFKLLKDILHILYIPFIRHVSTLTVLFSPVQNWAILCNLPCRATCWCMHVICMWAADKYACNRSCADHPCTASMLLDTDAEARIDCWLHCCGCGKFVSRLV